MNKSMLLWLFILFQIFFSCKLTKLYSQNSFNDTIYDYDTVYKFAEEMPTYNGGMENFYNFIRNNITIQENDTIFLITSFIIEFIVDKNGKTSNIIVKDKHTQEDITHRVEWLTKIFSKMPKWIPGRSNNKTVNVLITIPLTIEFANE